MKILEYLEEVLLWNVNHIFCYIRGKYMTYTALHLLRALVLDGDYTCGSLTCSLLLISSRSNGQSSHVLNISLYNHKQDANILHLKCLLRILKYLKSFLFLSVNHLTTPSDWSCLYTNVCKEVQTDSTCSCNNDLLLTINHLKMPQLILHQSDWPSSTFTLTLYMAQGLIVPLPFPLFP